MTIFGASRNVAEATPIRSSTSLRLADGAAEDLFVPAQPEPKAHALTGMTSLEYWHGVWEGTVWDERAVAIITYTVAVALLTMNKSAKTLEGHQRIAQELWSNRRRGFACGNRDRIGP
ncbi:hypothetical protein AB4097_14075 [Microvirga sp. 2MCAF35]|uniref:hypothetical protein n=1 Tax=Microvirga sp. 2MCAF35 TaxID=3232987 RepID=UPI003F9D917F